MARLSNGMTEDEMLAAGKAFNLGKPDVTKRHADVKAALAAGWHRRQSVVPT